MGKSWSSWSLINPCSTQAFVSSRAGRCLEHCLMNPLHLPAMHFAQQPFLCSSIKLALTDAILHSQVDHSREQISLREGAYRPLHKDKLSSQNRLEWVLKADWAGQMSSQRRIPDHWSKSHLSARLRSSLAYWWWRWDCVCNHFGRPVLGVSPAGSRRRWESRAEQRGCLATSLLSCMSGLWFIPTHSISLSRLREPGSDQDKQLARTSPERQNSRREWQRQTFSELNDRSLHKTQ